MKIPSRKPPKRFLAGSSLNAPEPVLVPVAPAPPKASIPAVKKPVVKIKVPVEQVYCMRHGQKRPCLQCADDERRDIQFQTRWEAGRTFNKLRERVLGEVAKSAGIRPDQKCVHGVYLYKHYCGFCAWEIIDPGYNPEIYRVEINKALRYAKDVLKNGENFIKRPSLKVEEREAKLEGQKDFEDLKCIVDIEIWKTVKKYEGKMSAALAYTVAKNQAGKYLSKRIDEQTILVEDADGNPMLDEFGIEAGYNGAELKKESENPDASPEDRRVAKELLERYAVRKFRFISMDVKGEDEEGEPAETSAVENKIAMSSAAEPNDWFQEFIKGGGCESLRQLAVAWHGDKRLVAEAMLKPGFTVRSVPGVDKSKVSRIRQVVLKEFKSFIQRELQNK